MKPVEEDVIVSKAEYRIWEEAVIHHFFESEPRKTPLVPTDGMPSVLSKQKLILVAIGQVSGMEVTNVVEKIGSDLPAQTKIKAWHVGKGALDSVSFGVEDGVFKHPACDVGGLTNLRQALGTAASFREETCFEWPQQGVTSEELASSVHAEWSSLSHKVGRNKHPLKACDSGA